VAFSAPADNYRFPYGFMEMIIINKGQAFSYIRESYVILSGSSFNTKNVHGMIIVINWQL
jgi:hypothetical protein